METMKDLQTLVGTEGLVETIRDLQRLVETAVVETLCCAAPIFYCFVLNN